MLPFLKNSKEASVAGPMETIERSPDDGAEPDLLDAVADDILSAVAAKDKGLLKSALEAFAEHLQDMDSQQDQSMMEGQ